MSTADATATQSASHPAGPSRRAEWTTLTIVSTVHLVSHFYWLVLVPLLPALNKLLGVSYIKLGFAITLANVVSALTQAPVGFMVDRFGARLLLAIGVLLGAAGFLLVGLFPSYWMLLFAAVLIGLGNAVYHPADFSILSAEMSKRFMGRAYAIHGFMGYAGFAAAPPIVLLLNWYGGAQFALIVSAIIGLVLAVPLLPGLFSERKASKTPTPSAAFRAKTPASALLTPAVIALTLMFTMLSLSTAMMQTYMVPALTVMSGFAQSVGETALGVFPFAVMIGVLSGGFVADKVKHQSNVAAAGFGLAAILIVTIAVLKPGPMVTIGLLALAGFLAGIIMPSRDLLVRNAAPPDAVGRIFGIVTTGFNFGGIIGPLIGGILIDHKMPVWIFYGSAMFMAATVVIALAVDRRTDIPAAE
ncbi:MAG: MFS transporter [Hyphomicrobiales bacterium]|nr:MFS transporter [Hyphomicrobiales bacterium]